MKTLIAALALTTMVAGVSNAYAWDQQATGAEMDYQLSREVATPSAYASARAEHRAPIAAPSQEDFQLEGR
jgi:hypothetical protein